MCPKATCQSHSVFMCPFLLLLWGQFTSPAGAPSSFWPVLRRALRAMGRVPVLICIPCYWAWCWGSDGLISTSIRGLTPLLNTVHFSEHCMQARIDITVLALLPSCLVFFSNQTSSKLAPEKIRDCAIISNSTNLDVPLHILKLDLFAEK